jgi:hypothetical protein
VPLTRAIARRTATVAALPVGLLIVAGCALGGSGEAASPSPAVEVDRISADIEEQLRQRDDLSTVDVWYQDSITVPESASVEITMTPGADPQAINDEAVRLVWESRLNPLSTIHVSVIDPVEPINGVSSAFNLLDDAQREPLEEKYGPHPD